MSSWERGDGRAGRGSPVVVDLVELGLGDVGDDPGEEVGRVEDFLGDATRNSCWQSSHWTRAKLCS